MINKNIKLIIISVSLMILNGCSKNKSSLTLEERAFVIQWNKWLEENPAERNNLRTRGIVENMTEQETKREIIALMVRFSTENNLSIPQRIIDDIKSEGELSDR
jgi:hypothetical protein